MLGNTEQLVRQHHASSSASAGDTQSPCGGVQVRPAEPRRSSSSASEVDTQVPSGRVCVRRAEAHASTRRLCAGAAPCQKPRSRVREEEYADYPGLESSLKSHSKFPKFVRKLTKTNLNAKNSMRLEIPSAFVKKHGEELHERVTLLERGGHSRQVELRVATYERHRQCRVYFSHGWRAHVVERRFREGDVLLFYLVRISTFVVRRFSQTRNPTSKEVCK